MEGHGNSLGEGVLRAKILEAKYEAKLEFPFVGGGGDKYFPELPFFITFFLSCAQGTAS